MIDMNLSVANRIHDKIMEDIDKEIDIDQICDAVHTSRSHGIRAFKKCYGKTPGRFMAEHKMDLAKKIIANDSSLPLKKVASMCGFKGIYHFSKRFKQITNENPGQFRIRIHKLDNPKFIQAQAAERSEKIKSTKMESIIKSISEKTPQDFYKEIDSILAYRGNDIKFLKSKIENLMRKSKRSVNYEF
jgi:AraC-like DNA-binding protein